MNNLDEKILALAQSVVSQEDVNTLLLSKLKALESTLKELTPDIYKEYQLNLYNLLTQADFSILKDSDRADE